MSLSNQELKKSIPSISEFASFVFLIQTLTSLIQPLISFRGLIGPVVSPKQALIQLLIGTLRTPQIKKLSPAVSYEIEAVSILIWGFGVSFDKPYKAQDSLSKPR